MTHTTTIRPATALAATLGFDPAELADYRYKETRTRSAIYAVGQQYFAASKKAPADQLGGTWREHSDTFWAAKAGTRIWVCDAL
jgi:hypothetical protein